MLNEWLVDLLFDHDEGLIFICMRELDNGLSGLLRT